MRYRLAVLTHGDATTLGETLASFDARVSPAPEEAVLVIDGPTTEGMIEVGKESGRFSLVQALDPQEGFCGATEELWDLAGRAQTEFVFWLEADFLFTRNVDLEQIASVLSKNPYLAQMSLMRNPENNAEIAAGSLVEAHPEWFRLHIDHAGDEHAVRRYMSQRTYWTTNPSLIPIAVLRQRRWSLEPRCEGVFSHEFMRDDEEVRFGVWSHGESWIQHIGTRARGFGY